MITHTMLVSFADPISDEELDRFISDIEKAMADTGVVRRFQAQRHIAVDGEQAIPAFIATAVLQFGVASEADLATLFAAPGAGAVIHTWQARHPYRVAWVNHEASA
ncbi:hypothetical protein [Mycolicibacterium goodii]|uniref:hypothetical protein n=1 Tax=Mycolicibacterium goodii TaxID=134601 RepID=UPI001BDD71B4|nr:hypothetical protein [Mycolicibacterium goodii]MBU8828762.1 hypothetical protein [Mycolicibacterium goodii]